MSGSQPSTSGLRPPPPAADGLDRACHPAFVCHQAFDGEERLKPEQMACHFFHDATFGIYPGRRSQGLPLRCLQAGRPACTAVDAAGRVEALDAGAVAGVRRLAAMAIDGLRWAPPARRGA
jgi:hypothetical protein